MRTMWEVAADACDPAGAEASELWVPFPKQKLAWGLAGEADECLFGGAAGPGKTEWLLEYGIAQCEGYDRNRAAIFRRVFPSLNRTVIPRLRQKLAGRARWNGTEHTFTFPNGSILECASLQYEDDVYDFQGAEYGWIGFEEITEFSQFQWEHLIGRLRSTDPEVRPHACATTNPGGRGHTWVKRRFVRPKEDDFSSDEAPRPFEVWHPAATDERPEPGSRVFVPATLKDNPALTINDPGYINRLRAQSNRGLRLALEEGDWDALDQIEGALWFQSDLEAGRISPARYKTKIRTVRRIVAVDPSDGEQNGDEFGVAVCAKGADGVGYVEQSHAWKLPVRRMAEAAVRLYTETGADLLIAERNHGGKWLLEVFKQVDEYANVHDVWASDGKRTRAEPVAALFAKDPFSELQFRARLVGFHSELEEELTGTEFVSGEPSPNRLDAMVWGLSYLMLGQTKVREREYRDERLAGRR